MRDFFRLPLPSLCLLLAAIIAPDTKQHRALAEEYSTLSRTQELSSKGLRFCKACDPLSERRTFSGSLDQEPRPNPRCSGEERFRYAIDAQLLGNVSYPNDVL